MIKILHIVHSLTKGGGLSNFVMNYYNKIDRNKIQFDFVYFKESENTFKKEISALGGKYYKWSEPDLLLHYKKEAKKFFSDHRNEYTAIHCHALFAVAAYANIAKKYGVKTIIAHSHNVGYGQNGFIRKIRNYYFIQCCKYKSDYKLACSKDAAIFMYGKKIYNKNEVVIIENAVDCKKFYFNSKIREKIRNELNLNGKFVIGHVGGFAKQKNHNFLVNVFSQILQYYPDSVLLLVGGDGIASGSTKKSIKDQVVQLGIQNNVIFTGIRSDVNNIMMGMDVFAFPSTFEGFGLVLVEAQASGLKCIASIHVPVDAKCTDNVTFLPLREQLWVSELLKQLPETRIIDEKMFDKYNIDINVKHLESIYHSIMN